MNLKLRYAIDKARAASMPKDNIERAIKKGTGELEGVNYEEILYEAYGPGGVAILINILTDNKNRAAAEIRNLLNKHGGNLGAAGSVAYARCALSPSIIRRTCCAPIGRRGRPSMPVPRTR